MNEVAAEAEPTASELQAEQHLRALITGLLRGARSERAHGKFHRGWQSCGMCHAVKMGLAFIAAIDSEDEPQPPDGEPAIELPEYEVRAATG